MTDTDSDLADAGLTPVLNYRRGRAKGANTTGTNHLPRRAGALTSGRGQAARCSRPCSPVTSGGPEGAGQASCALTCAQPLATPARGRCRREAASAASPELVIASSKSAVQRRSRIVLRRRPFQEHGHGRSRSGPAVRLGRGRGLTPLSLPRRHRQEPVPAPCSASRSWGGAHRRGWCSQLAPSPQPRRS